MLITYYGRIVRCEHVTAYKASQLATTQSPTNIYLTNCILAQVTNIGNFYGPGYIGSYVAITNDGSTVFQTVGAGNCYLAPSSPWRNYGTPSITPSLLADLRKRTTYPPLLLTNHFTNFTALGPQATRDTNSAALDLGWHYDVLDYCWSALNVTNNALLLLSNG